MVLYGNAVGKVAVTTAQTTAERQRAYKARQRAAGLKEIRNLWCRPEDEAKIRSYVRLLNKAALTSAR